MLISYLLKRKRNFFLLYFAIHRHNEGVVTYGIRVGSTRDLGFTTGSVDMIVSIIFLLIELLVCVQVIMVRGCRGGRRRGARGGGATPPAASMPEGSNSQGDEQVVEKE